MEERATATGYTPKGMRVLYYFLCLVGFVMAGFLLLFGAVALGLVSDPGGWSNLENLLFIIILEGSAAVAATYIFLRRDGLGFAAPGLGMSGRWLSDLAAGFAIGLGLIACIVAAGLATGYIDVSWNHLPFLVILRHGFVLLVLFSLQCVVEELIFRGYPFQVCVAVRGPVFGIAVFSILFGLLHLLNPNATFLAMLNTAAAGILLSVAFLKTRTLWLPIGIHWGWNFSQAFLFSVPVSGVTFPPDVFTMVSLGPSWLTGGMFGPEGGVLALIACVAASVMLWRSEKFHADKGSLSVLCPGDSAPE